MSLHIFPTVKDLLLGGDYNPDQWLHRTDILDQDIDVMQSLGVNAVSLGIFAWSTLEPEEGRFEFDWLDERIDKLGKAGVHVFLATPTAARPMWLACKYPEVCLTLKDNSREYPKNRHNFCWTSLVYREKTARIIDQIAHRYANCETVIGWHINNEYGGYTDWARCYCDRCIASFQSWLKQRYNNDLEELNQAWWTHFWSHTYQNWDQIRPGDHSIEALGLNWYRYNADIMCNFLKHEIASIRTHCSKPVTTNMHGHLQLADYVKLAPELDFLSYDSYPRTYGKPDEELHNLYQESLFLNAIRSLKKDRPWYLIESCPSVPQYFHPQRLKRPGTHEMHSLRAIAHGSDSVMYFQFRAGRGSIEKHHGAILIQDGPTDTRVTREVRSLRQRLSNLNKILGSTCKTKVAIIFDTESIWGLENNHGGPTADQYNEIILKHYRALLELGLDVDVIDQTADFTDYQFITAPVAYMLQPNFVERIKSFVKHGGHFTTTYWSGITNDDLLCSPGGRLGDLRDLLGISSEEVDCLREDERVKLEDSGDWLGDHSESLSGQQYCELIHLNAAEQLAIYASEFYAGRPSLTRNQLGQGAAYYQAIGLPRDLLRNWYRSLLQRAGLVEFITNMPHGVMMTQRHKQNKTYLFVINMLGSTTQCDLPRDNWTSFADNSPAQSTCLRPYDVQIFVKSQ
ncbi:Beta-galactosidase BglY [Poriferisphaera corsica]|uniref:Beta-galactosidase n=1 Tax=Poriferisphaera corsica TaxID=2528020 RepID=A0A517YQ02_9BACT|nr:beta-galactosidase [Poriferisphaera corsica]QDU32306.1 Beta-galactosidase BglY [Poriferisphaera corsica]